MQFVKTGIAATILALLTSAANAATATGTANANVISGLNITEIQGLYFGAFTGNGPFTIDNFGIVVGGTPTIAQVGHHGIFRTTGTPNTITTITTDPSVVISSGGNSMNAQVYFAIAGQRFTTITPYLDGNGQNDVYTSGTLSVNANQAPGFYTGTYNVTANY